MHQRARGATAALILSAGGSTRLGGFPKACLPIGEEPAVARIARVAREEGARPVLVVVGPHRALVAEALRSEPTACLVFHPGWESGRTGSVQAGLAALPELSDVLLWPVDHPFVEAKTVCTLWEAAMNDPTGLWFTPTFEGRGGHPVIVRSGAVAAIAALPPDAPLHRIPRKSPERVRRIPVEDFGVTANVDTEEAFRSYSVRFRGREENPWTVG